MDYLFEGMTARAFLQSPIPDKHLLEVKLAFTLGKQEYSLEYEFGSDLVLCREIYASGIDLETLISEARTFQRLSTKTAELFGYTPYPEYRSKESLFEDRNELKKPIKQNQIGTFLQSIRGLKIQNATVEYDDITEAHIRKMQRLLLTEKSRPK